MNSSLQAIKDLMEREYPDCSALRFIVSSERGRGFVQNFAHRFVGGILPSIKSYDDYKARVLADKFSLRPLERSEELVCLALFLLDQSPQQAENAGFMASEMLPAMRYARMFCLERGELKNLKGIRAEQEKKIDELFDTMIGFDRFLEKSGLFMPVLREREFAGHAPGEKDFFVNLPLFTPLTRDFFEKISPERKLVDMPVYADAFKASRPDFPSSLNLFKEAKIPLVDRPTPEMSFHELRGKATLPAYLAGRINHFLASRKRADQIFILLLDETLSFYLWQTVFKELGPLVNFSPGIPLGMTSPGLKALEFIDHAKSARSFSRFRSSLAAQLYSHAKEYAREEKWAMEAAIDFVGGLEKYVEPLGGAFGQVAGLLLRQKQFFLKGERTAPVQIVGLGETTGAPFDHGMIVPLNGGVFPSRVYNGPFLNFVHTPQIRNTHMETEELALRQFMSYGKSIDIVSVVDEAKDMTPSFFFTFLKNEFGAGLTRCAATSVFTASKGPSPFIENDEAAREKILAHTFSFTSLSHILTCPFGFYLTHVEKMSPPGFMSDEDNTSQLLGTFVHEFFNRLAFEPVPRDTWKKVFDELWGASPDIARLDGKAVFKVVLSNQIDALADYEMEKDGFLFFDNTARSTEKRLDASFGPRGQFRLSGRLDALVERDGIHTIIDYKYKGRPEFGSRSLVDSLSSSRVDPRLQIGLYAHLLRESKAISPDAINGCFVYVREEDPGKRIYRLERSDIDNVAEIMRAISDKLEHIMSLERLEPDFGPAKCRFCLLKSLCKPENFYRKSAR